VQPCRQTILGKDVRNTVPVPLLPRFPVSTHIAVTAIKILLKPPWSPSFFLQLSSLQSMPWEVKHPDEQKESWSGMSLNTQLRFLFTTNVNVYVTIRLCLVTCCSSKLSIHPNPPNSVKWKTLVTGYISATGILNLLINF
jgi:hypothetical protein